MNPDDIPRAFVSQNQDRQTIVYLTHPELTDFAGVYRRMGGVVSWDSGLGAWKALHFPGGPHHQIEMVLAEAGVLVVHQSYPPRFARFSWAEDLFSVLPEPEDQAVVFKTLREVLRARGPASAYLLAELMIAYSRCGSDRDDHEVGGHASPPSERRIRRFRSALERHGWLKS